MTTRELIEQLIGYKVKIHSGYTGYQYVGTLLGIRYGDSACIAEAKSDNPYFEGRVEDATVHINNIDSIEVVEEPSDVYSKYLPKEIVDGR